jgi:hypothetical protein
MSLSTRPKARLVNEKNKVTILQRIGVVIIIAGLLGLITSLFFHSDGAENHHQDAVSAPIAAISFFITMLGVAFAFPTMLRGKEGISTMRIVVFMMANVICMLLIKCGWQVNNLGQIGLDEWWMGVIAFVFGAKATQSYFESKLAVPHDAKNGNSTPVINTPENSGTDDTYTQAEVARFAVAQNEQNLRIQFPNIVSVSDTVADLSKPDSHVVALYLKDDNAARIPAQLEAKMPDGSVRNIATEVITESGEANPHLNQGDTIADIRDASYIGSICCAVQSISNPAIKGIVTSAHIFTRGNYDTDNNSILSTDLRRDVLVGGKAQAKWFYKQMLPDQDLIIAKLNDGISEDDITNLKRFDNRYYDITDADVQNRTVVSILAHGGKKTDAYILDKNINYPFKYVNGSFFKTNIILIGNTKVRKSSLPVSTGGDSGSPVFVTINNEDRLVGILLGSNQKFTFVLPIKNTISIGFNLI